MRRSNNNSNNKGKKENNLFNYFTKVQDPNARKESLTSIIARTTATTTSSTNAKKSNNKRSLDSSTPSRIAPKSIDLTGDDDDDDFDMPLIPPSPEPEVIHSVNSSQNSFSSQRSRPERQQNEEMVNTSKYNNRGWSAKAKERGHLASDQSPSASQEKVEQRYERIVLKKARITAKPTYDWLGPNDVKPYSSYVNTTSSYSSTSLQIRKPEISVQSYSSSSDKKEKYDMFSTSEYSDLGSQFSQPKSWNGDSIPRNNANDNWEYNSKKDISADKISNNFWDQVAKSNKDHNESANYAHMGNEYMTDTKMNIFSSDKKFKKFKSSQKKSSQNTSSKEYTPDLSEEQQRVLNMVLNEKKNIFFTGSAGTGKSVLLRAIIDALGTRYGSQLAVTASTGIAACNINGCTLHSFGGIGIGKESAQDLSKKIQYNNRKAKERWQNTRVLVIDEISMVDADLFDKLDFIARDIRQSQLPFGGMQIIVTGDFFQLPPVNPNMASKFAFEARCWPLAIKQTVMLTKVFRQKDGTFVRILNEMRLGRLSNEAILKFKSLSRKPKTNDDIEPTELYPLRNEVDISNKRRLDALSGEIVEFTAMDKGDTRKMQGCLAPFIIELKLHAQVMLLKNLDADLVNGSLGVVIGFVGKGAYTKKKSVEKLRTPHRLKESFMDGNGEIDMSIPYPVVKFAGDRVMVLERESWSVELPGGRESASREQIPLMLAWAISIHKSQGQTLDRVKVDLGRVFEKGQAYVALSRATSLDSLQILNFDPARVMAHPTVTKFYRTLQTV